MSQFVKPETVRLHLADVHRRRVQQLKDARPKTPQAIIAAAEIDLAYAKELGLWIDVKARLNTGEARRRFVRMSTTGADGELRVDPRQVGMADVLAYLVNWSLTHDDESPVSIAEFVLQDRPDDLERVLNNLEQDVFSDIVAAVQWHEETQKVKRAEEKKTILAGASALNPTSGSPGISGGGMTG